MRDMPSIPNEVNTPCCWFLRVHIAHTNRELLVRVIHIAKSVHGWRCRAFAFPPKWHLYIAKEDLTERQIADVLRRQGPVLVLNRILQELESGRAR